MNKTDILNKIKANAYVKKVIDTALVNTLKDGTNIYRVSTLEVSGNVMSEKSWFVYVLNDGTDKEEAFFKDVEPVKTGIGTGFMEKLQPLLIQYNAKILDSGVNWALCQTNTYATATKSLIQKKYFILDGVTLSINEVSG